MNLRSSMVDGRWPTLSLVPIPRAARTVSLLHGPAVPILPVVDHFASRPASPAKRALGIRGSSSPLIPSAELHVKNMAGPRELHDYMYRNELKVLILDVRTREAFDYEHIRGDAVVCIEPSVLLRDK